MCDFSVFSGGAVGWGDFVNSSLVVVLVIPVSSDDA